MGLVRNQISDSPVERLDRQTDNWRSMLYAMQLQLDALVVAVVGIVVVVVAVVVAVTAVAAPFCWPKCGSAFSTIVDHLVLPGVPSYFEISLMLMAGNLPWPLDFVKEFDTVRQISHVFQKIIDSIGTADVWLTILSDSAIIVYGFMRMTRQHKY